MARKYGRVHVSVWTDKDYQSLSLADQGLFCGLLAYPQVSWCGIIDYLPTRLTRISDGLTREGLVQGLNRLGLAGFVAYDAETDELLIRRFMHYDGVLQVQNMGKAMVAAYDKVNSPELQQIIVSELARMYTADPDLKGWEGVSKVGPELYDEIVSEATC